MTLPIVEVHSDRGITERPGILALLYAMYDRCELRAHDPQRPAVWARLMTSTNVVAMSSALHDPHVPVVVALEPAETPSSEVADRAAALIVDTSERARDLGEKGVAVSDLAIDGAAHPPLGTFNRARRRAQLGLPKGFVVEVGFGTDTVSDAVLPSALSLAAAVAVRGDCLVIALALGTPIVTDAASAQRYGVRDGVEVVVADGAAAGSAARELAGDERRAARLGRAATIRFGRGLDARAAATSVLARLGGPAPSPTRMLRHRLDELKTPTLDDRALHAITACADLASAGAFMPARR